MVALLRLHCVWNRQRFPVFGQCPFNVLWQGAVISIRNTAEIKKATPRLLDDVIGQAEVVGKNTKAVDIFLIDKQISLNDNSEFLDFRTN